MSGNRRVGDMSAERQVSAMPMRKMKVPERASARNEIRLKAETDHETDQIKIRPGHWIRLPSADLRLR